jgi:hypothetical protein
MYRRSQASNSWMPLLLMVQDKPTKRTTMDQVVERFSRVRKDLTNSKLRARIADRDEGAFKALYRGLSHLGHRAQYTKRPACCSFPLIAIFILLLVVDTTAFHWRLQVGVGQAWSGTAV